MTVRRQVLLGHQIGYLVLIDGIANVLNAGRLAASFRAQFRAQSRRKWAFQSVSRQGSFESVRTHMSAFKCSVRSGLRW